MNIITKNVQTPETYKVRQCLAAALVHDVGHGPFSHAFEAVGKRLNLKMANHELVSDMLIRDSAISEVLKSQGSGFPNDVADVISGRGEKNVYRAVVSSQFDADRLDYMRRDRLMTGTQHAGIDFAWLLANLEIGKVPYGVDDKKIGEVETFVLGPKAIHGAEAYVLGLFQLYPTVYFHKATRGAEKMFTEFLARIITLVNDGSILNTGLPTNHPLVKFAKKPDNIESALALDDTVVWGSLSLILEDSIDTSLKHFAECLRDRKLPKCLDIRETVASKFEGQKDSEEKIDLKCAEIKEKLTEWKSQESSDTPIIIFDSASRTPYKPIEHSGGPLDQINIRTQGNILVDLKNRSPIVNAIPTFKLLRAYVDRSNEGAKEAVEKIIRGELQ